jgi:hypothetical protein
MKTLRSFCFVVLVFGLTGNQASLAQARPSSLQIFKTPTAAAQALYGAWSAKNRTKAQQAASTEAVEKLFSVKRRVMKFKGCQKREEGDFECLYEDKKNDLQMAMLLEISRRGYRINSISFSSEAQ